MALYFLIGVSEVVFEFLRNTTAIHVLKPLLMPSLLIMMIQLSAKLDNINLIPRFFYFAIVFAWLGDIFLMFDHEIYFILGLLSFLVMQILYIASFRSFPHQASIFERGTMSLLCIVLNYLIRHEVGDLQVPVIIYSIVLCCTSICAAEFCLAVRNNSEYKVKLLSNKVSIGMKLFVLSDGLIALSKFGVTESSNISQSAVMLTYIAAQGLIVVGFIDNIKQISEKEKIK